MARVKGLNKITGTLANISFYTIQGSDQVYVRTKGGPKKKAIKTKPQFEKLRRNNSEWAACAKTGRNIREAYYKLKHLEDYPAIGALNALAKRIQVFDEEAEHGRRGIYLSKSKELLCGFSLSRKQVLESVLRVPIDATIDRDSMTARIFVPAIDTNMYLHNFSKLPYFRLFFQLGGVCDMVFIEEERCYNTKQDVYVKGESDYCTEWFFTTGTTEPVDITLTYNQDKPPVANEVTLLLTVGLEFGRQGLDGNPVGVKYAGCGKIMKVG